MPTYDYRCTQCGDFEVIKRMSEASSPENCPDCGIAGDRVFTRFFFHGAAVQNAEWNPALGCVVNNKYHRSELAKRHNLIEVGNDFKSSDSVHKTMETQKQADWKRSWEKV